MMNSEMTLNMCEQNSQQTTGLMAASVQRPLQAVANYYGKVLERPVNVRQTLCLLNAQAAFVATVFPADGPFLLRVACGIWLVVALLQCREAL